MYNKGELSMTGFSGEKRERQYMSLGKLMVSRQPSAKYYTTKKDGNTWVKMFRIVEGKGNGAGSFFLEVHKDIADKTIGELIEFMNEGREDNTQSKQAVNGDIGFGRF